MFSTARNWEELLLRMWTLTVILLIALKAAKMTPGHAIEAMWFIMDLGKRLNRPELIEKAKNITLTMLEYGWDKEYGGIYYFMDRNGYPPPTVGMGSEIMVGSH